jgi:hypothetical protein
VDQRAGAFVNAGALLCEQIHAPTVTSPLGDECGDQYQLDDRCSG